MEYYSWLILAIAAAAFTFIAMGRLMSDLQNADFGDCISFMVLIFVNIIVALNASVLDFITTSCTTGTCTTSVFPYTGEAWVTWPFYAMFLLCIGFFFIAVIKTFAGIKLRRGY